MTRPGFVADLERLVGPARSKRRAPEARGCYASLVRRSPPLHRHLVDPFVPLEGPLDDRGRMGWTTGERR